MQSGQWIWIESERRVAKVIDMQTLWGVETVRVWIPALDAVKSFASSQIAPLTAENAGLTAHHIAYLTAAARIADALNGDILLAPLSSSVIPLPHQLYALSRAMSSDRIRYLLADEVGLGKTIEAGLILRELKLRGLVRRILVVAPKGLTTQWVSEMRTHFGERFELMVPGEMRLSEDNLWEKYAQVVCPLDSVKPLDTRHGWSRARIAEYNRIRFEDLIAAGWDLIIIDEAHRLGGSTEQVARYRLGQALADAAPYLLLLSATPHQGKTDAFHRLVALLDEDAFPDLGSVARDRVQPYVIRTEKRNAIDGEGEPLFKPRQTRLAKVQWNRRHAVQQQLYDAVTEYVREGYNRALLEKKRHIGFLMILMQRLVTSSTWAIRTTLERRLDVLNYPPEMLMTGSVSSEDWAEMDGQEQLETVVMTQAEALRNERAEVEMLLDLAQRAQAQSADAKAEALLEMMYALQREEGDSDLKFLIFTEFVSTQDMLREFLEGRGFSVVCLNGSMDLAARQQVQSAFAANTRILVSTDAGGEGLNLQLCHIVVNYDIPWNPMRLEQRIGRVDRIGQKHTVRAINLILEETVEYRVREVLEQKLAIILAEFGIDKAGDVLDSVESARLFDELYVDALLHPESIDQRVDEIVREVEQEAEAAINQGVLPASEAPFTTADLENLSAHPVPYWLERMTTHYLRAHGGKAEQIGRSWSLRWPDGKTQSNVVFSIQDTYWFPDATQLSLEDERLARLVHEAEAFVEGQPIPRIAGHGIPPTLHGFWSLWKLSLGNTERAHTLVLPLFVHDDGRILQPAARSLWEKLLSELVEITTFLEGANAESAYQQVRLIAEQQTMAQFDLLVQKHNTYLEAERQKTAYSFQARRRAVERLGLPEVRSYRLKQLASEKERRYRQLEAAAQIVPVLQPYLLIRVQ
ncbi:MAG: DEAD/DEAH box helicase family protein [Chloroflexi bacterium]|uniref:DEAD/DEAH box helicase n=1 Tax=Candidatus Flexifilum breve TaxID=3140694 RepID=UPI0031366A09|nr:DEAD/DEAH box helicase family protein [Chloroflexota bacterium]